VHTGELKLPVGYALPDLITVTDLEVGGEVDGTVTLASDGFYFEPLNAWRSNHRYAWTVPDIAPNAHGPSLSLPSSISGTAVFRTSDELLLLGASGDYQTLCLVLSRRLTSNDDGASQITVDDQLVDEVLELVPDEAWGEPYDLFEEDTGVDVICVDTELSTPGSTVRLWWGDLGPLSTPIVDGTPGDIVTTLRRGNW
jgi:hypothetical protein